MKSILCGIGAIGLLLPLSSGVAEARYNLKEQLRAFEANPKEFMSNPKNVQKYLAEYEFKTDPSSGEIQKSVLKSEKEINPEEAPQFFSKSQIESRDFVAIKNRYHEGLGIQVHTGRAPILANDNPEDLLGKGRVEANTLAQMERRGLMASRLSRIPWKDDYWPILHGGAARRYGDAAMPRASWKVNSDYVRTTFPKEIADLTPEQIDLLSPAQKYDLLVGDKDFGLTEFELNAGSRYVTATSDVEGWMGKCHGWSPASFSESRPHHATFVRAFDPTQSNNEGVMIRFYPSDIKALATTLWASSHTPSNFIGSRCQKKKPATDENGRILDPDCFDTNPGTWHLTVVNRIGIQRKSFVLDATYDYQVWNQPAFAYEYDYFNPKDLYRKKVDNWTEAQVALADFPEDRFKRYRSKDAVSVVGIHMKFTYVREVAPVQTERDVSASDVSQHEELHEVHYLYDLELDADGQIIGGEWYQEAHPDFLWAPKDGARAQSIGDEGLARVGTEKDWLMREFKPIYPDWRDAAILSSKKGQPLAKIVRELIEKSRKPEFADQIDHTLSNWFRGWFRR